MKKIGLIIGCLLANYAFSQDLKVKEIKTDVNEVTVFINEAQISSKKEIEILPGKTDLKFVNLSPFIDSKSVQVKADGEITILSVNHQQNYLDKLEKSTELKELELQIENINDKINIENTYLAIVKDELTFLYDNRTIGGKNDQVNVANLQQASEFYSTKLTALKMKEIERTKKIEELYKQQSKIQNQINTLSTKKEYPSGEILVRVDAKKAGNILFEISYIVSNAGWFPSYDIRAKNINEPIQIIYKANVRQDTKVDWNNVKLKFSSSNPNASGVAPNLIPYYLNYNSYPPSYKTAINSVSGVVMDNERNPLPGATVMVTGSTIGTSTDLDGRYSLTIPHNATQLTFDYIGFESKTVPISGATMNVMLESSAQLEEVVVMGYATKEKRMSASMNRDIKIRGASSIAIPTAQVEKQTTVEFEIKMPYTIKSDNKSYAVDMETYELPAIYQYYCVPKIDKDAFLIANIIDWEKYNLLEGEANIYFENTYVGKTLLNVKAAADTLEISLGRDKKVSVNREKTKDLSTKQFIGVKKEETRAWKTTIKNNKTQMINIIIMDQIPVSTLEEIEINVQEVSGATHQLETGEIKWNLNIEPNNKKELLLKYSVKYPKANTLIIE